MFRACFVLAIASLAVSPIAAAQGSPDELVGRRIRIQQLHGATVQGALVAVTDTTVTLRTSETDTVSIARGGIARVEVYEGMKSGTGKGALTGLLIGGLGGALIGVAASGSDDGEFFDFGAGEWAAGIGITFGALGAGIGALIGSGSHTEKWSPAALPSGADGAADRHHPARRCPGAIAWRSDCGLVSDCPLSRCPSDPLPRRGAHE